MNYYFAKAVNANPNIKNLVSNTCDIGGGAIQYDESWEHFYNNIFTPSNLFKILFTDCLGMDCTGLDHSIIDMRNCRFHWSPTTFKYKLDTAFRNYGLHYLTHTGDNLFLTDDRDIELCNILRDAKKFTYQSDNLIYELPITEEEFIEKYVNNIDGYPMLSQLIIIELFYIHYKLEDDCLKFELIMETIRNLSEQEEGSPYSLACMLYAYIVLAKIMFDRIACEDSVYPADYWDNE
jgi:hypothetical protein